MTSQDDTLTSSPEPILDNRSRATTTTTTTTSRRVTAEKADDDAFEGSRSRTRRQKVEADVNSNDLDVDNNKKKSSITNGYSSSRSKTSTDVIENKQDSVDHEADVASPDAGMTSPEPVTSPEVMSQDESDDNVSADKVVATDLPAVAQTVESSDTSRPSPGGAKPSSPEVATQLSESGGESESDDDDVDEDDADDAAAVASADGSPVFLKKMSDFKAYEDDSARFDVQTSGAPEPDVQWLKNDMPIVVNRRKFVMDYGKEGRCSLIVKFCDEDDEAVYSCRAVNDKGQAVCKAQLTVKMFSRRS